MGRTNSIEFSCEATIDARPTWLSSREGSCSGARFFGRWLSDAHSINLLEEYSMILIIHMHEMSFGPIIIVGG